jgi:hypothetical protein
LQNGCPQDAAWCARRAYESLDHFVITNAEINLREPDSERVVLSHPLVQAELKRQKPDMRDLFSAGAQDMIHVARRLRERAKTEAETVFG